MRFSPLFLFVLAGCAAVNPNPNIGARSTDMAMQSGDCVSAMKFAEPGANRGEPWAQYRMGMILIDTRCPRSPTEAIAWLEKAATYRAESAWEKGSEVAVGTSGYFNTRESSTNAALALGQMHKSAGYPAMQWYWVRRAASQYDPSDVQFSKLTAAAKELEKSVPSEEQEKITKHWDSKLPWHK